jgi:hypothetical protein
MTEDGRNFGIVPTLEAISYQPVASVRQAARIASEAGCQIVLDTLHFNRFAGAGSEDQWDALRAHAASVQLLQLCDGPAKRPTSRDALVQESRSERDIPGEGGFELAKVVALLPDELPVSVEAPSDRRVAELGELEWARRLKSGVNATLARAETFQEAQTVNTVGLR